MAAALVGWSRVSRRTLACQYGSRAELAIIVDRHDVPIETSSPVGATRLLWHATQLSECAKSGTFACGLAGAGPLAGAADWAPGIASITETIQDAVTSGRRCGNDVRRIRSSSLPELGEPTIEPVPHQIGDNGRSPFIAFVERNSKTTRDHDVLDL